MAEKVPCGQSCVTILMLVLYVTIFGDTIESCHQLLEIHGFTICYLLLSGGLLA